jgi:hypothetical protein
VGKSYWESLLASEGLTPDAGAPPPWHRTRPGAATSALFPSARSVRVQVQLPDDWRDGAEQDYAQRVLSTALNREIAGWQAERMADYVWRETDWSQWPGEHREVMELVVVDGPPDDVIAVRTGLAYSRVRRILTTHRRLAGI